MLSNFKEFVKSNYSDITLIIGIVLVALVSFGAGLLIDLSGNSQDIIIQNPTPNINPLDLTTGQAASAQQLLPTEKQAEQGVLVGSVNSNKYHWPDCSFAKRIAEQNQIWFNSEEEAQNAGYIPCGSFERYRPTNP